MKKTITTFFTLSAFCVNTEYKAAENQAKDGKLGIWSEPGLHQTPWEWRQQ